MKYETKIEQADVAKILQSFDKVEVQEYPWGWIRWLMSDQLDPKAKMTFGIVQVNGGVSNPPHVHPNCEEVLYMLAGKCEHRVGDKTVVMEAGDVLRIPQGVIHGVKVLSEEPMRAVIAYNAGDRQFVPIEP